MIVKIHEAYRNVVAICDSDLLGKKFEEGKLFLDLSGSFFMGDERSEEEVREIIEDQKREDATFNIAGKRACEIALELGIIDEEGVTRIQGIPVALVLI